MLVGAQECRQLGARAAVSEPVVLQIAGYAHSLRRRADGPCPLCVRLGLHQEQIDLRQHRRQERTHASIARERARRDAPVGDRDARAAPMRLRDQIGPKLGFHQHEQGRIHDVERAAHGRRPVKGRVEDAVSARQTAARQLLPCHGRRRHQHRVLRKPRLELRQQRPRGQHLSDRHGVDPDRARGGWIQGARQTPAARPPAGVGAPAHEAPIGEVRKRQYKGDKQPEIVEKKMHSPRSLDPRGV